jgi:hypothetical protein
MLECGIITSKKD